MASTQLQARESECAVGSHPSQLPAETKPSGLFGETEQYPVTAKEHSRYTGSISKEPEKCGQSSREKTINRTNPKTTRMLEFFDECDFKTVITVLNEIKEKYA